MEDKKILEMQSQIEMLTKLIGAQNPPSSDDNRYITVESLSPHPMYMHTGAKGSGELYFFEKIGDTHNLPSHVLRDLIRHNRRFVKEGMLGIQDEEFIKNENLLNDFKNFINFEEINNLLKCKRDTFSKRFDKLSKTQQHIVCDVIIERIKDNKKIDEEVLFYINHYLGRNLLQEVEDFNKLLDNGEED